METVKIAIVATLVPVGAREPKADATERFFALHLSASFEQPLPAALPDETKERLRRLLIAWQSNWSVSKFAVKSCFKNPDGTLNIKSLPNERSDGEKTPKARSSVLGKLQDAVVKDKPADWNPVKINEPSPAQKTPQEPALVEAVHALSLFAGSVPQDSKILHFFKIKFADWTPQEGEQLFAAPDFIINQEAIRCEPRDDFDPAKWTEGWLYNLNPVNPIPGVTLEMRVFVKPLTVKSIAGTVIKYDDEPEFFDKYWFRVDAVHPWTARLEDISADLVKVDARLKDAQSAFENNETPLIAGWENARLAALAFFAQWQENPPAASFVRFHHAANLIQFLKTEMGLTDEEATVLRGALTTFQQKLKEDKRRETWLNVFRRNGGEALTPAGLFNRFAENNDDFELILFYQWNYAVENFANQNLKDKWRAFFQNNLANQKRIFVDGDNKTFGMHFVRETFKKESLAALVSKPTAEDAETEIAERLKEPGTFLARDDYFPRLVAPEKIAELWSKLAGYFKRYADLQIADRKIESKPGGLTIQFSAPEQFDRDKTAAENPTTWRKIAGVGVVAREKTADAGTWHFLNAATVKLRGISPKSPFLKDGKLKLVFDVAPDAPNGNYRLSIAGKLNIEVFSLTAGVPGEIQPAGFKIKLNTIIPRVRYELEVESLTAGLQFAPSDLPKTGLARLFETSALIPVRVPFRNDIRHPILTYNQRSLIAPTALADALGNFTIDDQKPNGLPKAIYEYEWAHNGENHFKLVPLKFGKKYEMAAFVIDTAGGLPVALADGAPWITGDLSKIEVPTGFVADFDYRRRVAVGQVRVSALAREGQNFKPQNWLEIPAKVTPIAWEIEPTVGKTPEKGQTRSSQLILLYEPDKNTTEFVFGIKPPTIDIDVFERWLAVTDANLQPTMTDYFNRLNRRGGEISAQPLGTEDEDLLIDDPAVTRLFLTLEVYNFNTKKWKVVKSDKLDLALEAGAGIKKYQRDWIKVLCRRAEKHDLTVSDQPNAQGFSVIVDAAQSPAAVSRLRVFALVPKAFAGDQTQAKFPADFFKPDAENKIDFLEDFTSYDLTDVQDDFKAKTNGFYCLKPYSFLIETPNAALPKETALWQNLTLELAGANRDVVRVSLKKQGIADELRNVVRCELLRQQWRWQGRPFGENFIKDLREKWIEPKGVSDGVIAKDFETEFLQAELAAFADIDDVFDILTEPLPFSHDAPELIQEESFAKDLLSRFVRYGLRVYSRYEGLFPAEAKPRVTKQFLVNDANNAPNNDPPILSGTGWRRVLIRYRGAKPTKPVVQAVVPLTQNYEAAEKAGSLLLVLDETMYEQCGITERIECEVMTAALPKGENQIVCGANVLRSLPHQADQESLLHQAGHDQLVRTDNAACELPDPAKQTLALELVGAFGHTFDTGARQSLFGSSSFIVRPYIWNNGQKQAAAWDFAKVRFRRLSGSEPPEVEAEEKDWTEPLWVQFLPAGNFDLETPLNESLKLTLDLTAKKITLSNNAAENPFLSMATFKMFKYCLLLTFRVKDFRGVDEGHEVYHDCVRLDFLEENGRLVLKGDYAGAAAGEISDLLSARLIEAQTTREKPSDDFAELLPEVGAADFARQFWEKLFAAEATGENTQFRITRISESVGVVVINRPKQ